MQIEWTKIQEAKVQKIVDARVADALAALSVRVKASADHWRTGNPVRAGALRALSLDIEDVVRDLRGE